MVLVKQLFRKVACINNILANHTLFEEELERERQRDRALTRHSSTCLDVHSTLKYLDFSVACEYKKISYIKVGFRYLTRS